MLVIYSLVRVVTLEVIAFNIIVLLAFILIARYIVKKREKELQKNKKARAKIDRNAILDVLIDSLRQPTLLLSSKNRVLAYNQGFSELLGENDVTEYVENSDYIQRFLRGGHNHRRFEIVLNNKTFYVDLDKISSEKINGTIITYSDISQIKEMYERQENFIGDIKHELKTPITAIVGLSDLLVQDKVMSKEDQTKVLKTISNETQRLDGLITTLTSTIESQSVMILTHMDDIFEELKLIYDSKDIKIDLTFTNYFEDNFVSDKEVIKQIIINLVDNALKFTDEGYVKVTSFLEDGQLKIAVVDTGIGISKEEINNIFERFYRIDKSRDRNTGGFGLGLSIVKSLLEKINGAIDVISVAQKGSTFTITIPIVSKEQVKDNE